MSIALSGNPFGPSFTETISIQGQHPTAGLEVRYDPARQRVQLIHCTPGTPVARISRWRSRLKHAYLLSLNDIPIADISTLQSAISLLCDTKVTTATLLLTFDDARNSLSSTGLPQLYFDQLRDLRTIQHHLRTSVPPTSPTSPTAHRLTRRGLMTQPDWSAWLAAEAEQLDSYKAQGMFGTPCQPPNNAAIFHWVWIYKVKTEDNNRKKARAVCDGSTRGGQATIAGHTYAPTPDMTDLLSFLCPFGSRKQTRFWRRCLECFCGSGCTCAGLLHARRHTVFYLVSVSRSSSYPFRVCYTYQQESPRPPRSSSTMVTSHRPHSTVVFLPPYCSCAMSVPRNHR
jgi:hypothetical protein